jgi:hypothetical protein
MQIHSMDIIGRKGSPRHSRDFILENCPQIGQYKKGTASRKPVPKTVTTA